MAIGLPDITCLVVTVLHAYTGTDILVFVFERYPILRTCHPIPYSVVCYACYIYVMHYVHPKDYLLYDPSSVKLEKLCALCSLANLLRPDTSCFIARFYKAVVDMIIACMVIFISCF